MQRIPTTISRLEIFLVYMDRLNMQDVSELLAINTLSVYRAIHRLEEDLGYLLFKKAGRNLEPLPSAKLLKDELQPLLDNIGSVITAAKIVSGSEKNKIRIGLINSLSYDFIPFLNERYATKKDNISISFISGSNYDLLSMLKKFEIDAVLAYTWDDSTIDPSLVSSTIFEDSIVYVTADNHPTATLNKPIDAQVLREQTFRMLGDDFGLRRMFNKIMTKIDHKPIINSEFSSIFTLIYSLQSSNYASMIPARLVPIAGNLGITAQPLADELCETHDVCIITHKAIEYSPLIKELVRTCKSYRPV